VRHARQTEVPTPRQSKDPVGGQMSTLMSLVWCTNGCSYPDRSVNRVRSPGPFTGGFPLALPWAASYGILPAARAAGRRGERNSSPQPGALLTLGD
jgi:hypothetical protein